jgi:hypothetical protein
VKSVADSYGSMETSQRLREMRAYIISHPDLSRYCQLLEQAAIELESRCGPSSDAEDAARYRWLRSQNAVADGFWIAHGLIGELSQWCGPDADRAIDAAMSRATQREGEKK